MAALIQLLGHTHAHGIRETAHIRRANGERVKVFEQYDYLEPQIFMYDSLTQNPMFSIERARRVHGHLPAESRRRARVGVRDQQRLRGARSATRTT